jgi:hypothetical protein
MITIKSIKIFNRYIGDGDGFVRSSTKEEQEILNYTNWKLIDEFIQDIKLVKKGLASNGFAGNLSKRLIEHCDSEETIRFLKEIAEKKKI